MTKKLTELTQEQRDRMPSFAQEFIEYGWRTEPLTEAEWATWEAGAKRCYEYAGIRWPDVVVRGQSPIVGAFAAPAAQYALDVYRQLTGSGSTLTPKLAELLGTTFGKLPYEVDDVLPQMLRKIGDSFSGSVNATDPVFSNISDAV